jgi:hypothetical protein
MATFLVGWRMQAGFKHPKVYADLVALYGLYWPIHQGLPKGFRYTSGEQILRELTLCIRAVTRANFSDKQCPLSRRAAAQGLLEVRTSLEVIRGLCTLAWQLKWLSHGGLALLCDRLDQLGRQTTGWQQWFEDGAG